MKGNKLANIIKAEIEKKANNYWDRYHPVLEEEISFHGDKLEIDGEWRRCSGKVYVEIQAELEYETLPDGETRTGRTYLEIREYKILELMEIEINDEPNRKFTEEEKNKILEENREIFEDMWEMPSLREHMEEKINEPGDEPW